MGKGRDPLGGLSEVLEGRRRGDRLVAFLPPAVVSLAPAPEGYDGFSWCVLGLAGTKQPFVPS